MEVSNDQQSLDVQFYLFRYGPNAFCNIPTISLDVLLAVYVVAV